MYTYQEAANLAALVLYAAEMNDKYHNNPIPPADPRIKDDEWKVIAYISADDISFSVKTRQSELPDQVCYGYIARKNTSLNEYVVAIRGTDPTILLEDIHDGLILQTSPWARFPTIKVSRGFFSIYDSMKLLTVEPGFYGDYSNLRLAEAITRLIGVNSRFTITAHSLGSAIASYLMYEIGPMAPNHSACCLPVQDPEIVIFPSTLLRISAILLCSTMPTMLFLIYLLRYWHTHHWRKFSDLNHKPL